MIRSVAMIAAMLLSLSPTMARPQGIAPSAAEIRLPSVLDRKSSEAFKTDEAELIDRLRESAKTMTRPADCAGADPGRKPCALAKN